MFSKKHWGYAFVGLLLIGWLVLIDSRNINNPRAQHVTVERDGMYSFVECEIWNPRYEDVYVEALVRLVDGGSPSSGIPPTASPYNVVKACIGPRSSLPVRERIKSFGSWYQGEVRVFVINDPAEVDKIVAASTFTNVAPR